MLSIVLYQVRLAPPEDHSPPQDGPLLAPPSPPSAQKTPSRRQLPDNPAIMWNKDLARTLWLRLETGKLKLLTRKKVSGFRFFFHLTKNQHFRKVFLLLEAPDWGWILCSWPAVPQDLLQVQILHSQAEPDILCEAGPALLCKVSQGEARGLLGL